MSRKKPKTQLKLSEIIQLRKEGLSYQKIADKAGTSRQWIHQMLQDHAKKAGIDNTTTNDVYIGLHNYMESHNMTYRDLGEFLDEDEGSIRRKCQKESDFTIAEIRPILNLTGMKFEECFEEKTKFDIGKKKFVAEFPENPGFRDGEYVYKGLMLFMETHGLNYSTLGRLLDMQPQTLRQKSLETFLFNIREIKKILELTGMTFEECFSKDDAETVIFYPTNNKTVSFEDLRNID